MIMIYGVGLDSEGRCLHYHTKRDVVALKCNKYKESLISSGKFYETTVASTLNKLPA